VGLTKNLSSHDRLAPPILQELKEKAYSDGGLKYGAVGKFFFFQKKKELDRNHRLIRGLRHFNSEELALWLLERGVDA